MSLIPYSKQFIDIRDRKSVLNSLNGKLLTQGPILERLEKKICKKLKVKYSIAVTSATAGLHLCNSLFVNKKVICPSLTFASSVSTILLSKNIPILCDINKQSLLLDLKDDKVNFDVILNVLFSGCSSNSESLRKKYKHKVIIEDASHALGGKYNDGSPIGSCKYSDLTVFSLHPVKSITSGEGGIITTNNKKYYEKLKLLRNHGILRIKDTNKNNKFLSKSPNTNKSWYYEINNIGFNYRLNEIQAALAISQLAKLSKFIQKRREIANFYDKAFSNIKNIEIQQNLPKQRKNSAHHLYTIRCKSKFISRDVLQTKLASLGIGSQVHYIPAHKLKAFRNIKKIGKLSNTDYHFSRCLSLPMYYNLNQFKQQKIVRAIKKIFSK